ncbi:MAG: hypothetical protein RLY70_2765 [Planctomycetota bacterium]
MTRPFGRPSASATCSRRTRCPSYRQDAAIDAIDTIESLTIESLTIESLSIESLTIESLTIESLTIDGRITFGVAVGSQGFPAGRRHGATGC